MPNLSFLMPILVGCVLMIVPVAWFCGAKWKPAERFWPGVATIASPFLVSFVLWLYFVALPVRIEVMAYLEAAGFEPQLTPGKFNSAFVVHFILMHGSAFVAGIIGILVARRFLDRWQRPIQESQLGS